MIWRLYSKGNVDLLRSFKERHEIIKFIIQANRRWVGRKSLSWIQLRDYFSDLAQTQLRPRQGYTLKILTCCQYTSIKLKF